ncbi:hypothetical protein EUX98_g7961 [Antrodiella citrinella]|uniref:Uncharacterized protein n=1 Tax=Antrodiella citrinella TaxID=2447956 RepID=A0A4S4MEA2_9APHY|nr:hypothetical protein EUX98_g7961 [Antrodiella citrinella]
MYKELMQLETPQVHHARLLSMLIAPHCFAVFVYLFTFLASLSDYPENNSSVKYLAEKFAWRLFGGPNKEMARELMEWLLTRWERIAHDFKSEDALAWEKQRDAERKAKAASAPSASSSKDAQNEKGERRGSSGSDYSDNAPAPRATVVPQRPAALRSSFRDPDTPKPHRRVLIVEPGSTPRRPSDTSITSRPEDTPVTEPFDEDSDSESEYEAEDEDDDDWDAAQRDSKNPSALEHGTTSHSTSDGIWLEDIIAEYIGSPPSDTPPSPLGSEGSGVCIDHPSASDEDDMTLLKQQLDDALREHEASQRKLAQLSKKLNGRGQ